MNPIRFVVSGPVYSNIKVKFYYKYFIFKINYSLYIKESIHTEFVNKLLSSIFRWMFEIGGHY